ncbi:MAG: type II toxin-antitoxin system RelE/ParE family toxin [Oscillospiraceae bacterium]|nr:type II toxin-antitoxin system RelE/ParE family toxin [Oscillospiraceae bacterium]
MYDIIFYKDKDGNEPIRNYIDELYKKPTNKDSRIKLKKIIEYIGLISRYGVTIGQPVVKHITGTDLWELRPTSDRVLFAYWKDNMFILLHHFTKKTNKTPSREIKKALSNLNDFIERNRENNEYKNK